MATKFPHQEYTRVIFVPNPPGIVDITAPTLLEVNHPEVVDLSCALTTEGLQVGVSTNSVTSGSLCSRNVSEVPGSTTHDVMLTGFRYNDEDDDAFWYMADWGVLGLIVIRRGPRYDQAWASGDPVEVRKGAFGDPSPANSAADSLQDFSVKFFVDTYAAKGFVGGTS